MKISTLLLLASLVGLSSCAAPQQEADRAHLDIIIRASKSKGYRGENQPIFQALAKLAESQGLDPKDFTAYRVGGGFATFSRGAFSQRINNEGEALVLVVQTAKTMGPSAVQLVLLSSRGVVLDRLQCHINGRHGTVYAKVFEPPENDGTYIAIRRHINGSHNSHTIVHAGVAETFRVQDKKERDDRDEKELARVGIAGSRFDILFPRMKREEQPTKDSTLSTEGAPPVEK
jgi:hypothetical protein